MTLKGGETTELVWENEVAKGKIQIQKVSSGYNEITKKDQGAALKDAKFEVFDKDNLLVESLTTDENGMATTKELPLGSYTIKESEASPYYLIDEEAKSFPAEIKVHGELLRFVMKNAPVKLETSIQKRGNVEVKAGDTMYYDFSEIENKSNVPLSLFTWEDLLPTEAVRLEKIWTGTWLERQKMTVYVKTNLKKDYWKVSDKLLSNVNNEIDISGLNFASNEYVTAFKVVFEGEIQPSFRCKEGPKLQVKVLDSLKGGTTFTNKTQIYGRYREEWCYQIDGWTTISKPKGKMPKTGK